MNRKHPFTSRLCGVLLAFDCVVLGWFQPAGTTGSQPPPQRSRLKRLKIRLRRNLRRRFPQE